MRDVERERIENGLAFPAKAMTAPLILSIDSGIGGLSVVGEIRKVLPQARHLYICDSAYYPYGLRHEEDLLSHFLKIMHLTLASHRPDAIVIACNTLSTICLPHLRAITDIPVIGVVPAIKPACALSKKKIVGLLATSATVKRDYTARLIEEFAKDCTVIPLGAAELVEIAEEKARGQAIDRQDIARLLAPLLGRSPSQRPDVIVLACTHFPLLQEELSSIAPDIAWVDSGAAIARRVSEILKEATPRHIERENCAIVTGADDGSLRRVLQHFGFPKVENLAESLSSL